MVNDQSAPGALACYSVSCVGFSHLKNGKPCQDYSAHFQDEERVIVTACDGHGGAIYIRSERGSRFASEAICRVFGAIGKGDAVSKDQLRLLRLKLLCEWNDAVEKDLAQDPIRDEEIEALDEDQRFRLRQNPFLAYGTTMHGAMILGDRLFCASIGDGGIFSVINDTVSHLFQSEDEDTVANVTHSMCEEKAEKHLQVDVLDFTPEYDGILLCTDGTLNPYHSMTNFSNSFALPVFRKAREGHLEEVGQYMEKLGGEIGTGDDVSLAIAYRKQKQTQKPDDET